MRRHSPARDGSASLNMALEPSRTIYKWLTLLRLGQLQMRGSERTDNSVKRVKSHVDTALSTVQVLRFLQYLDGPSFRPAYRNLLPL